VITEAKKNVWSYETGKRSEKKIGDNCITRKFVIVNKFGYIQQPKGCKTGEARSTDIKK
jgi:hypothetical protein